MKIIHTYAGAQQLKHYTLDKNDKEHFLKLGVSEDTFKILFNYIKNSDPVTIIETYDGQSMWRGFQFLVDGVDLSVNGFCFNDKRLLAYLKDKDYIDDPIAVVSGKVEGFLR